MTTTTPTKTFHLGDVLSITHDILVSKRGMDGVHEIIEWLAGEPVWTHQLPRVGTEAKEPLLQQFPRLREITIPDWSGVEGDKREVIFAWLDKMAETYGETFEVAPLGEDHTSIGPLTELHQIRPDLPVVAIMPLTEEDTDGQP